VIAALYVDPDGPYFGRADVDPWDLARDAKLYPGPWPVVAHPPCGPWGKFSWRCKQDKSAGPAAVDAVRKWGGVLEHPYPSALFRRCGMPLPGELPDRFGGYTIRVDQARWGHQAPKDTLLYLVRCYPAPIPPPVADPGGRIEFMSRKARRITPPAFAEWLIQTAQNRRTP
jgi:hypothetical protein